MAATSKVQADIGLTYKAHLTTHRDQMIELLVTDNHMPRLRAEDMVDNYWPFVVSKIVENHRADDLWEPALAGLVPDLTGDAADAALAEMILDEAFGFLATSATNPGFGPSLMVDWGWHEAKDPTMVWGVFCQAAFGRVLHHEPDGLVTLDHDQFGWPTFHLEDTVAAMRARGPVRELLWLASGKCGNPCDGCCSMRCRLI